MKITVDQSRCIGTGCCAANAPTVFRLNQAKLCMVIEPSGGGLDQPTLFAIAKDCPTASIILVTDSGDQIYP
jgi:ferredoxin